MRTQLPKDQQPKYNFHGRRMGRGLKAQQKVNLDDILGSLEIKLSNTPPLCLDHIFQSSPTHLTLEIGTGGGEHCAALAEQERTHQFIAAEAYIKGVASLLGHIQDKQLDNIRIFADDVRLLLDQLPPNSLDRAIILFPDPWPKTRHNERRIVQESVLKHIVTLLKPGAEVRIATDHVSYLAWMIEHIKRVPQLLPTFDWDELPRQRPESWPPTRYEQKALKQGRGSVYMTFKVALSKFR